MNFSLGGAKRVLLVAFLLLPIGLAGCSGDDSSPLDDAKSSSTPSADPKAADEAAVKALAVEYWEAVTAAENNADTDPKKFTHVARGLPVESELSRVADYKEMNLRRVGKPVITEVEALVTGDTADIRLCKNEDDWTAEVDGEALPDGKKFGTTVWGAEATRVDGEWLITDVRLPPEGAKTCS